MSANFLPRSVLIMKLHVAKRQLGLDDADYRATLLAATGKDSAATMSANEMARAMEAFESLGFRQTFRGAPDGKKSARPVIRLIFGLWTELGRRGLIEHATRPALLAFVEKMTRPEGGEKGSGIGHPDWLSNAQANKVVEALKAIRDRGKSSPNTNKGTRA